MVYKKNKRAFLLDPLALINPYNDMIQHDMTVYTDIPDDMLKAQNEHWADIFANYVAANINLASREGQAMNEFVRGALAPYIGNP